MTSLSDKIKDKTNFKTEHGFDILVSNFIWLKDVRAAVKKLIILANAEEDIDTMNRWIVNINAIFGSKLV